jgi:hypothetical protein
MVNNGLCRRNTQIYASPRPEGFRAFLDMVFYGLLRGTIRPQKQGKIEYSVWAALM